jgi:hypothetical protein
MQKSPIYYHESSLHSIIKLPNELFGYGKEILLEAFAGYLPLSKGEDMPTTEYSVRVYQDNALIKKIILHSSTDYGVVSEDSIRCRSNYAQMVINLVTFIVESEKIDLKMYNIKVSKKFSTDYRYLQINLPSDFIMT